MYKIQQFIQATILLLVIIITLLIKSSDILICMLSTGILMTVFTIRSFSEKPGIILLLVQTTVSVLLAVISGKIICFLLLYECQIFRNRRVQFVLPALFYLTYKIIIHNEICAYVICNVILLLCVSEIIYLAECLCTKYISAQVQNRKALSVTAVNEMYEKKLNQELIMKNYFADKNARLEERENISRNIHNSVGHSITAAVMTLDAADMLFETKPDKAREKMNTANERIRTSLDLIRRAVRVLDNENEYVSIKDFTDNLISVIDSFTMDTMIKIQYDFSDVDKNALLAHEHSEFLTGAAEELLSNGVRHGNADSFTVILNSDSKHIMLKVCDNGKSNFSQENQITYIQNGFGLKKIISYTKKCGGSATFSNENGFKAEIVIPY